jgi:2-polyprenyl-3-methyl-5-hydroxy-6-metoxy-1,4-benzoquinol methylase
MLEPAELFPEVPNLYEYLSVHSDMVYDEERVNRYALAINQQVNRGDVVVDIGTGTGLLAFLCIRAGAKRVHAIERSTAINWAKLLADHHHLSDKIIFYSGDSRNISLPEKADIVISELIGHMAFEEGMVESLYDAKSRFLNPQGAIIPRNVSLKLAPVYEVDIYNTYIDRWENAWGIEYSLLRKYAVRSCYLTEIKSEDLMAIPQTLFSVDFMKNDDMPDLKGTAQFRITRTGNVSGIALWFDAVLSPEVLLSSGPWKRTHWMQCFAPMEKSLSVKAGDKVSIYINMELCNKHNSSFNFEFEIKKER